MYYKKIAQTDFWKIEKNYFRLIQANFSSEGSSFYTFQD